MSVYHDLLQSTVNLIQSLGLGITNIQITLLPKAEEQLDTLPLVCVCPHEEPETISRAGFESSVYKTYLIQVVIISAGNLVLDDTNLPTYMSWRQAIARAFQQTPLPNFTSGDGYLWNVIPSFDAVVDKFRISEMYDYQSLSIRFFVSESI